MYMKIKGIQAIHVFSKDDRVYIKENGLLQLNQETIKVNNTEWYPVHFQWIPVSKNQKV